MLKTEIKKLVKVVAIQFQKDVGVSDKSARVVYEEWYYRFGEDYIEAQINIIRMLPLGTKLVNNIKSATHPTSEKEYDEKGNGSHYNTTRLNDMVKYERTYGTLAVMSFCEISAQKYRDRIGKKKNQPLEQEVKKMNWYDNAAKFYFERLRTPSNVMINNRVKTGYPWDKK